MIEITTHITTSDGLISAAFIKNIRKPGSRQRGFEPTSFVRPWFGCAPFGFAQDRHHRALGGGSQEPRRARGDHRCDELAPTPRRSPDYLLYGIISL